MNFVASKKRIVIKIGSAVLSKANGEINEKKIFSLVSLCEQLKNLDKEIILVSSGAVALGRKVLDLPRPLDTLAKQACASIGQALLMERYRRLFKSVEINCAQVLVTHRDFSERQSYLSLEKVFSKLLSLNVIPIVNENDVVSAQELSPFPHSKSFGDNDRLSALVAGKLNADLLIMFSNVDGVFTANPQHDPDAKLVQQIDNFKDLSHIKTQSSSQEGRGGMSSKLEAARIASICGVDTLITSGLNDHNFFNILQAEEKELPGTLIKAQTLISERKQWIALASGHQGVVIINQGAEKALMEKGASLLSIGALEIQGEFSTKDVISIQNEQGKEIGRGLPENNSQELQSKIGQVGQMIIHRNNLVLFERIEL